MLTREIPFRPRLEGDFRIRFYNAVSRITEDTTLADIENIADEEIKWVTSECTFNLDQRKKYRAVWFLFRDLIHASWKAFYRDGVLYMNLQTLNENSTHDGSVPEVKQLLRSWMSESRHERLLTFTDFIKHMETRNSAGHDISELIADGPELANRLEQAHAGRISVKQVIQPYLQLVTENERDQFTGFKISEIWRYFRLTWSTPSETTPGRTIDYWSERWLSSRLNYEPIYERIRAFDKNAFMVGNQIDGEKEWSFPQLEVAQMPANDEAKAGLQFVRDFYRGSSGYADHIAPERLSLIHLKTRLDSAIIDAAKNGKDIVLTGNPGDGKTHIIRIMKPELEKLGKPIEIVLDASTLSNREIFDGWVNAHDNGKAFVIAINAAILYSVNKEYGSAFAPIAEAYRAMTSSIVFHNEEINPDSVVVFDLSKREVLTPEVLAQAITKLTSKEHYKECDGCPLHDDCVVTRNRALLNGALFQKRLSIVLERVVLQGYHATLREVQSLTSILRLGATGPYRAGGIHMSMWTGYICAGTGAESMKIWPFWWRSQ